MINAMKPKYIALGITVGAFTAHEALHYGQDELPHVPEEPAPVLMPKPITVVTSTATLSRDAALRFLAQLETHTGSGHIFSLA